MLKSTGFLLLSSIKDLLFTSVALPLLSCACVLYLHAPFLSTINLLYRFLCFLNNITMEFCLLVILLNKYERVCLSVRLSVETSAFIDIIDDYDDDV